MNHRIKGFLSLHMAAPGIREDIKRTKVSLFEGLVMQKQNVQTTKTYKTHTQKVWRHKEALM